MNSLSKRQRNPYQQHITENKIILSGFLQAKTLTLELLGELELYKNDRLEHYIQTVERVTKGIEKYSLVEQG